MAICTIITQNRSSHPEMLYEKSVLKNFAKFTEKYLCQSVFFDKVADQGPATVF